MDRLSILLAHDVWTLGVKAAALGDLKTAKALANALLAQTTINVHVRKKGYAA